jgi:hypothetical protein
MSDGSPQTSINNWNVPKDRPPNSYAKQAIVVIHGIGEQVPMETLRDFVHGVWQTDDNIAPKKAEHPRPLEVWSKPDERTGSLELRRITTRETHTTPTFPGGVRSDFYELYWADLSAGSTWGHITNWLCGLLWRNPCTQVPRVVLPAWIALWGFSLLIVLSFAIAMLPRDVLKASLPWVAGHEIWWSWGFLLVTGALTWIGQKVVIPYVGRIVRYTRAIPDNIDARAKIRARGLALLDQLHKAEYQRIIVVGHSLGSILAYDLVSYYWAMRIAPRTVSSVTSEFAALREVEAAVRELNREKSDEAVVRFRNAQSALCRALRSRRAPKEGKADSRWLITDLVTLGSPLGHAEFLLARDRKGFEDSRDAREFPVNPPVREVVELKHIAAALDASLLEENSDPKELMSFHFKEGDKRWILHHAAPFAAVRWTNIHDPARFIFWGDIVSRPAAPLFGKGVVDVNLRDVRKQHGKRAKPRCFTHTAYWSVKREGDHNPPQVVALRDALDLAADRQV